MTNERAMELLRRHVNSIASCNNTKDTINLLIRDGFEPQELVRDFDFSISEVEDATGDPIPQLTDKKYKLHARIAREIEVTEEQMERLCNHICASSEHDEIDDIKEAFIDGITSGDYDDVGYIPHDWIEEDFIDQVEEGTELREYFEENACVFDNIEL